MTLLSREIIVTPTPDGIKVRPYDPCDIPADLASYFARLNANGGMPGTSAIRVADIISEGMHYRRFSEPATMLDAAAGLYQLFQSKRVIRVLPNADGRYTVELFGEVVK